MLPKMLFANIKPCYARNYEDLYSCGLSCTELNRGMPCEL